MYEKQLLVEESKLRGKHIDDGVAEPLVMFKPGVLVQRRRSAVHS